MPKRAMELLTESMFYVLMALREGEMCGADAAEYIARRPGAARPCHALHHPRQI